jgi:hypothetical protein
MTGTMNDLPSAEIDWTKVLGRCVDVENWSDFHDEIYGSGVLLSDYNAVLAASELEGDELLELGTVGSFVQC